LLNIHTVSHKTQYKGCSSAKKPDNAAEHHQVLRKLPLAEAAGSQGMQVDNVQCCKPYQYETTHQEHQWAASTCQVPHTPLWGTPYLPGVVDRPRTQPNPKLQSLTSPHPQACWLSWPWGLLSWWQSPARGMYGMQYTHP